VESARHVFFPHAALDFFHLFQYVFFYFFNNGGDAT